MKKLLSAVSILCLGTSLINAKDNIKAKQKFQKEKRIVAFFSKLKSLR